jgi:hypothetical protein
MLWSAIGGFAVTVVLTYIALTIENETVTGILLWQDTLIAYLIGPGPLLFVDDQGQPQYEGTPLHMLILPVGFILSIPIYSLLI